MSEPETTTDAGTDGAPVSPGALGLSAPSPFVVYLQGILRGLEEAAANEREECCRGFAAAYYQALGNAFDRYNVPRR